MTKCPLQATHTIWHGSCSIFPYKLVFTRRAMEDKAHSVIDITSGIHHIETAVIKTAQERGLRLSEHNMKWNFVDSKAASFITVHITWNARVAGLVLPRECYEEAAGGVNRTEVWDAIHDCINALMRPIGSRLAEPAAIVELQGTSNLSPLIA